MPATSFPKRWVEWDDWVCVKTGIHIFQIQTSAYKNNSPATREVVTMQREAMMKTLCVCGCARRERQLP